MAKYIKSLKYKDPTTSTTYTVDSRAIKSSTDSTKTMDDLLDGKANTSGSYAGLSVGYSNAAGTAASAINATAADDADTLDGKHASEFELKLPTTDTAGKVLKSTSTAGTVEWGDVTAVATWGNITGTLSSQTDLQSALDAKFDKTGGTITGNVTVNNGTITGNLVGDVTGNADSATLATKLGTATLGNNTKPIYLAAGVPTECTTLIATSQKGVANGVAELDSSGKVPSAQLPAYVDDVVEGYYYNGKFYEDAEHTTEITGESGKIYVDLSTNKTYRWSGSAFVEISSSLALGETESTAYRGDRGKIAYDHSQSTHARTDATVVAASTTNGNIKINGTETTVYTHPGSGTNPHGTTYSDVGAAASSHTHSYAGSSSAGGAATSANKVNAAVTFAATGGASAGTSFNGSSAVTVNYTTVGAAASSHTHSYAGSSSAGGAATSANKVNSNLAINVNGGTAEGTTLYTFNGSAAKTINLVPGSNVSITGGTGTITIASTNTTYSGNNGIGLSGTTFYNSGVRSVATGSSNGTISVNTNGTSADVPVKGLGSAAYTASSAYATASHTHSYLPLSGGTLTGCLIMNGITSGNYTEGIRINKASDGWATLTLGTASGSTSGAPNGTGWTFHCDTNERLVFNHQNSTAGSSGMYLTNNNLTVVGSVGVGNNACTLQYDSTNKCLNFVFS